jgi:hypothetical protein
MRQHLRWLGGLVVVLVLGMLLINYPRATHEKIGVWLPDFSEGAQALTLIQVTDANGLGIKIMQDNGRWLAKKVGSDNDYLPANVVFLSEFVSNLAKAKKLEQKTSDPEKHHYLGLKSVTQEDSLATLISLHGAEHQWDILIGNAPKSGGGKYVRFKGDNQAWLVDLDIDIPPSIIGWLDNQVLARQENEIERVQLTTDTEQWTMIRSEDAQYVLENESQNKGLKYPTILNGYIETLFGLSFVDVLEWNEEIQLGLPEPSFDLSVLTSSNETIMLTFYDHDNKHWLKLTGDSIDPMKLHWLYEVSQYSYSQMNKTVKDFLIESQDDIEEVKTE